MSLTMAAIGSAPVVYPIHIDDAEYSTTSTTPALQKTFRFIQQPSTLIKSFDIYVSAWNASSGAVTTITVSIDNGQNYTLTTSSTNESVLIYQSLPIPLVYGIHTFNLSLSTSNASYSAYTKLLEVYAS